MELWTIQSEDVLRILEHDGIYTAKGRHSRMSRCEELSHAFNWYREQMRRKVELPEGLTSSQRTDIIPVWAWHSWDGKQKKPDMRNALFRNENPGPVLLHLEVDENRVIVSDHERWLFVLQNYYCPGDGDPIDIVPWYRSQNRVTSESLKYSSWNNIFKLERAYNQQATLWSISMDDVVGVYMSGRRGRHI